MRERNRQPQGEDAATRSVMHQVYQDAEAYGRDLSPIVPNRIKAELVLRHLRPEDEVLDVGCANGLHLLAVAGHCRRVVGIDIHDAMLAVARDRLARAGVGNVALAAQSASALAFAGQSFDLVYSFSTLLLVPDIRGALGEIARVLRPGGLAILDIAGRYNLSHLYHTWYYRRHGHFGVNAFGHAQLVRLLGRLGLRICEEHALGFADQWKYVPGLHLCRFLDRFFHAPGPTDLDYRLSNSRWFFSLANRWYVVCRKSGEEGPGG